MHFETTKKSAASCNSDGIVLFLTSGDDFRKFVDKLENAILIDMAIRLIDARQFKPDSDSLLTFEVIVGDRLVNVLLVGVGEAEKLGFREIMYASGAISRKCTDLKVRKCSIIMPDCNKMDNKEISRAIATGFKLGVYNFIRHKTNSKSNAEIETVCFHLPENWNTSEVDSGIAVAEKISAAVCLARNLANEPSNVMTPSKLAEIASEIASKHSMECELWDRSKIESENLALFAAVSRGSKQEPRFIKITYKHPEAVKAIALVGKGITFDTGGYNLKPGGSMESMKDDMSGAADVLGVIDALGHLKPKLNLHVLIPATENCIGGSAVHPGDVFTAHSGKTVEINNTDAEGRLVLSDAISYAKSLEVDMIIDLATLTGACVVALGTHISGLMSNSDELSDALLAAAHKSGEKLHRLPLDQDYKSEIKSNIADIKNTGGRQAGTIVGGLFIEEFVGNVKWAHIDLSSATLDAETAISRKGSSGSMVATLVQFVMDNES